MVEPKERTKKDAISPEAMLARGFVENMFKLARLQRMYNPNNELIKKQTAVFFEQAQKYFDRFEVLVLRITPTEIIFRGEPVYENANRQQSYAFKMFKDGVRKIIISKDVTRDELAQFLGIVESAFVAGEAYEDLLSLLWKADFEHIAYRSVKGFREITPEALKEDSDKETDEESYARQIFEKSTGATVIEGDKKPPGGMFWKGAASEIGFIRSLISTEDVAELMGGFAVGGGGPGGGGPGGGGPGGGGPGGGGQGGGGGPLIFGGQGAALADDDVAQALDGAVIVPDVPGEPQAPATGGSGIFIPGVAPMAGGIGGGAVSAEALSKFVQILDSVDAEGEYIPQTVEQFAHIIEEEKSEDRDRLALFELARNLLSQQDLFPSGEMMDLVTFLSKMLDLALLKKDIPLYFALVDRIYVLLHPENSLDVDVKKKAVAVLMNEIEGDKLRRLVMTVAPADPAQVAKLASFLRAFRKSLPDEIIEMLESVDDGDDLSRLEDLLVRASQGSLAFFKNNLYDRRAPVAKAALKCLARMATDDAVELMMRAARHPSPEVRITLLRLMKIRREERFKELLRDAMMDRDSEVRLEALRQIAYTKDRAFRGFLEQKIESRDFEALALGEKITIAKALASMAGDGVEPLFLKMIEKRSLLRRDEANESRIAAAEALAVIGGEKSREALVRAAGSSSEQLRETCERLLRGMQ
jgi:HEAT repeat protein